MYYLFKICALSDLHIKTEVAKKKYCILYEVSMYGVIKKIVCSIDQDGLISRLNFIIVCLLQV